MTGRLAGKVCVITGATGIAEASALAFAREGASLFVMSNRGTDCEALGARLGPGVDYAWAEADLRTEEGAVAAFGAFRRRFDRLDAVLASAGGSGRPLGDGPLHDTGLAAFQATLDLNLITAFLTAREALRVMLAQEPRGGSIVFVSSVAATDPVLGLFDTQGYSAAKGGINALMVNGACQYAPHGVRFNVIAPALTVTPMSTRAASDPDTLAAVKTRMGLTGGGPLAADDHANAALFLCSDESRHVTGQLLKVDGGWAVN